MQKLSRQHYAERRLASASGTFRDLPNRKVFFDEISTTKPDSGSNGRDRYRERRWTADRNQGCQLHCRGPQTLSVKITGTRAPEKAVATLHTITAPAKATASLEHPDAIAPVSRAIDYSKDLTLDLAPFSVMVLEIRPA